MTRKKEARQMNPPGFFMDQVPSQGRPLWASDQLLPVEILHPHDLYQRVIDHIICDPAALFFL